jgi:phosphoribosylaminoimidazole (AIR) synthetase
MFVLMYSMMNIGRYLLLAPFITYKRVHTMTNVNGTKPVAKTSLDPAEGDSFSSYCYGLLKRTFENSKYVKVNVEDDHFRGRRDWQLVNLPPHLSASPRMDMTSDGVGTAVVLHIVKGNMYDVARRLFEMVAIDMQRDGGYPILLNNVLETRELGSRDGTAYEQMMHLHFQEVIRGLYEVARDHNVVLFKGETAELGDCVGNELPDRFMAFNWDATCIGIVDPSRAVKGDIQPGDFIVAFEEPDLGSNGYTDFRTAMRKIAPNWWDHPHTRDMVAFGAKPCKMYSKMLAEASGWTTPDMQPAVDMKLIVHVTGGSMKGKLFEDHLQPLGLSAVLTDLFEVPPEMLEAACILEWDNQTFYRKFNGGQRLLIVVRTLDEVGKLRELAKKHEIASQICGSITASRSGGPALTIISRYLPETFSYR